LHAAQESLLAQLVGPSTMPEVHEADIELRTAQVGGARAGRSLGLSLALAGRLRPGRTAVWC